LYSAVGPYSSNASATTAASSYPSYVTSHPYVVGNAGSNPQPSTDHATTTPDNSTPPAVEYIQPPPTTQWLYKNSTTGKYQRFAAEDCEALNAAIREWDAAGRHQTHVPLHLMGQPCVVDLVNMTFLQPQGEPVKIKSRIVHGMKEGSAMQL